MSPVLIPCWATKPLSACSSPAIEKSSSAASASRNFASSSAPRPDRNCLSKAFVSKTTSSRKKKSAYASTSPKTFSRSPAAATIAASLGTIVARRRIGHQSGPLQIRKHAGNFFVQRQPGEIVVFECPQFFRDRSWPAPWSPARAKSCRSSAARSETRSCRPATSRAAPGNSKSPRADNRPAHKNRRSPD